MNITVLGAGYVGLSTGVVLAYLGHQVTFVDVDPEKVELLNRGKPPFFEPGLREMLSLLASRIHFTTSYREGMIQPDVIFIAVNTPQNPDGSPNLIFFQKATEGIQSHLANKGSPVVLVVKSTVAVGTADNLQKEFLRCISRKVRVISSPEFLRQGRALFDTFYPARFVFGGDWEACNILLNLYDPIINQTFDPPHYIPRPEGLSRIPVYLVDSRTAELAKYAANAFLAMKVSFINEIANVAELVGADVAYIADIIGADPRIGREFLNAGAGYGGSCFPKDTRALRYISESNGYDFRLLSAVIEVNNRQPARIVAKLREALGGLGGKIVAVLGLAFKPGTDDLREAPSIAIISSLIRNGASVRAHDPVAGNKAREVLPLGVEVCQTVDEALDGTDAAVIVTEWEEYRHLEPDRLLRLMRGNVILDGRNCLDPQVFAGKMHYLGIGRGTALYKIVQRRMW